MNEKALMLRCSVLAEVEYEFRRLQNGLLSPEDFGKTILRAIR